MERLSNDISAIIWGWAQQKIADKVDIGHARISGIINNANFCIIDNLIAQGREMPYIAGHLIMDLATAWVIKRTGLKDQEKFKPLEWGLRTRDQWYFNNCDDRFGDDWPGRILAQLVALTLFSFHNHSGEMATLPFLLNGYFFWFTTCRPVLTILPDA